MCPQYPEEILRTHMKEMHTKLLLLVVYVYVCIYVYVSGGWRQKHTKLLVLVFEVLPVLSVRFTGRHKAVPEPPPLLQRVLNAWSR
jgi:hypothetical protein